MDLIFRYIEHIQAIAPSQYRHHGYINQPQLTNVPAGFPSVAAAIA